MHVQIIIGSIREGRKAKPVGEWAHELAARRSDLSVELVDLKEWGLPLFSLSKPPAMGDYEDPLQQRWADKVSRADAYLFVSPEYNHGYSPALKNALDYLYAEWNRKPASFIAYGGVEGARSVEQLRGVLIELRMAPIRDAVHIAGVSAKLEEGRFTGDEQDERRLSTVVEGLLWWHGALSAARSSSA